MKRIKVFILALLVIVSFAFMPPKVYASEITTEPEITTEVTEGTDLADALEVGKTWVVAAILYLVGQGVITSVVNLFIKKGQNKAFEYLSDAVSQNKISQSTADKATQVINDGVLAIEIKMNNFENNVTQKIEGMEGSVKDLIEKLDSKFLGLLITATKEYIESDLEEETIEAETEETEEV